MFFGLTNSPATFQTMMNDLFRDLISKNKIIIYMDDIMIFSRTLEEHRRIVKEVLRILRDNNLYLKPEKCEFEKSEVEYLGLVVGEGKISMDPVKVKGISEWPEPECKTDLQQFLGFINFYRRFIRGFAETARPLHVLTGKSPWKWGTPEKLAFRTLKEKVTSQPVLALPMDDDQYKIEADSSDYATGAVLSQLQNDKWVPIAYMSKSLNDVERNYEVHDKEMLAIMRALSEWRQYLHGARKQFEIWTDHKNLEYFLTSKNLNRRQARWSLELAEYDFTLRHKPGKQMLKADLLSRRKDHRRGEKDNSGITLLKPELLRNMNEGIVDTGTNGDGFMEKITKSKGTIEEKIKEKIKNKEKDWSVDSNSVVTWQGRVYVPKEKRLREEIIKFHHDSYMAGHPGRYKTAELVLRNYWWPGLHSDVKSYVRGCEKCQRTKTFPEKPRGTLAPNTIPQRNWQYISVDLITQLPPSLGHNAIMVVVDRLSKMIRVIPTNGEVTSEGIAKLFRDRVWKDFGLPEVVISDRGTQFISGFMKDLYRSLGVTLNPSTAYHPQTDGQTERINQEIEEYLRLFVNHKQTDWAEWLALAEFCYNDREHTSTKQTPFFSNLGLHPRKGGEPRRELKTEAADTFAKRMQKTREEARSALGKAAEEMARYYNRGRSEPPEYKPGDKVYLDGTNLTTDRPAKKLDDRRYGPFEILEKVGARAYKLKLPSTWKIHPVFNTVKLRLYHPPETSVQQTLPPPPPLLVHGTTQYEVETVLDSRMRRGKLQYLVKWVGYPREENSWEPEENLSDASERVSEFHKTHPNAPQRLRSIFTQLKFRPYENYTERNPGVLFDWTTGKLQGRETSMKTSTLKGG
jgi:RNase H-like domain found in reverse transcriptase/Reverse transcriptase (RNA-dependent DNA polymerase)/Integrase zinc binding domain/Chromo (CHRromatin Organisation MOdifier) domain